MSTRKLLLADDSITIQKVVNLTFADEGIEVIAVGNGDSAMEKMAEISPDLVMADINMPGLTGYQVCERIKQDENFKNTPVILLVGSFEPFDEAEARRVGADDFLTKPFQSIRQLVNKVTVLLDANDQSAANLYAATANNSFADTLDMNEPEITHSDQANDLGDAGMDDEMIQSTALSSFALDESAKFETRDFASYEAADDYKKTQPLSVYDLKEFSFVADSPEKETEFQFSENADTGKSEPHDFQSFNENNFVETESAHFAENKTDEIDEDNSQPRDSVEDKTNETQPDAQDFYESVLEESEPDNQKKQDFSSFLNSSDDDLLEIPFDEEDEEWETPENVETPENNSTESTTPTSITEGDEQNPSFETEEEKIETAVEDQDQTTNEIEQNSSFETEEEKTKESFAEQESVTEDNEQSFSTESAEQSTEQDNSLIEELPQPESFEENQQENPTQEFYESEETAPQETGEETQTAEFSEENSSAEFNKEFQNQESDSEIVRGKFDSEISSPEVTEEVSEEVTDEEKQPEYVEPEENYHGENEVVVGSLIERENNASESADEEEKAEKFAGSQQSIESLNQLSPEVIDAIARRVVEMLSDKVVREIAWEVVPQHADLVIKKAVEEEFKEKLKE